MTRENNIMRRQDWISDPSPHVGGATFTVRAWVAGTRLTADEIALSAMPLRGLGPQLNLDPSGRPVLSMQIRAADMWLAILQAMVGVTSAGQQIERLEAVIAAGV